jgi:hypothetical protein
VPPVAEGELEARLRALGLEPTPARLEVAERMRSLRQRAAVENQRFGRIVEGLAQELPPECHRVRVPRLDEEVRDLSGLARLADLLVAAGRAG